MNVPIVRLADVCTRISDGTHQAPNWAERGIPFLFVSNIRNGKISFETNKFVSQAEYQRLTKHCPIDAEDVLYTAVGSYGNSAVVPNDKTFIFQRHVAHLKPRHDMLDAKYLAHILETPAVRRHADRVARGVAQKTVTLSSLREFEIPLPPLDEQKRIASILDKADQLRQKRRQAIALLDSLTRSIFLEMFGDPAINSKNFPLMRVGELAEKYSDGPFGSNLKSEHYVDQGIRIIRLQNIGVGEFIDDDRAYITEEHFNRIAKHECLPGDVLIGTLGDPNLRACVQPRWLTRALNKADCVQLRPNANIALSEYCSYLLNQESTMRLAQGLVLGQTRGRISMGRLRDLELPIAPLPLQARFASIVRAHEEQKQSLRESAHQLGALFFSLQQRAFSGQL